MSTKPTTVRAADVDDAALRAADVGAVFDHFVSGQPLDPTLVERMRTRAEQVTADIRRIHGLVDDEAFQSLLDDEA